MADDKKPDPGAPDGSLLGGIGEEDLDDLLSRATSLASELSGGVGESDTSGDEDVSLEATGAGDTAQVAAQLDRADALAQVAADQIGAGEGQDVEADPRVGPDAIKLPALQEQDKGPDGIVLPPVKEESAGPDGITLPPVADTPSPPEGMTLPPVADSSQPPEGMTLPPVASEGEAGSHAPADIPDFMAEFTQPEAAVEPAPSPPPADTSSAAPSDGVPDFMAEFTQPETGDQPAEPPPASDGIPDFMAEFTQPETAVESAQPMADAPADQAGASGVPDFMAEFTQPEADATPAGPPGVSVQAQSIPLDDATLAEIESGGPGEELSEAPAPPQRTPAAGPAPSPAPAAPAPAPKRRVRRRVQITIPPVLAMVARKSSPLLAKLCRLGAHGLELMDRPLGFVREPLRDLLGLVALATLGVAAIVFVISLF